MKPTLEQEWDKPTGTTGAEQARPENGAMNGGKGANGSGVTPLFARAEGDREGSSRPPHENSVRSEIQRVRLDLLSRETERLQQKLRQIFEERQHDRAVIDALRVQIEELTRQGLRMAARSEGDGTDVAGDPELERRIKPLLHTLLRMLERAKKDSRAQRVAAEPEPETPVAAQSAASAEGDSAADDAWSQIDAARKRAREEAARARESVGPDHEPPAAPWDEIDTDADIPRPDEGFVEIAKLLHHAGSPAEARAERSPSGTEEAEERPSGARTGEEPAAKSAEPGGSASGAPKKAPTTGALLLGTERTPRVAADRPSAEKAAAAPEPAKPRASPEPPIQQARRPVATRPSPPVRRQRPVTETTSHEVTLRRAAEIVDRFGPRKSGAKEHKPAVPAETDDAAGAAARGAGPERTAAEPREAARPKVRYEAPVAPRGTIADQRREPPPQETAVARPPLAPSENQRKVDAKVAATARRGPANPPPKPPPAGRASAGGAKDAGTRPVPRSYREQRPHGGWAGEENDPMNAALPKCLTEPWDDAEGRDAFALGTAPRGGPLRWPFRKSRGHKRGE